jgi:signal transduction histidine kinase
VHVDSRKEPLLEGLEQDAGTDAAVLGRIRGGQRVELVPELDEDQLRERAPDPASARLLRALGTRSLMVVPLSLRGRTLGSVTMGTASRRYERADLELASEIARRAAVAIEHAWLYREAREAISMRDEFLAVASHELYTPMTSLGLSLEMLTRLGSNELAGPGGRKLLGIIEEQGRRLTRLIGDLLDVSRLEARRLLLSPSPIDLAELARQVVGSLERQLAKAHCDVRLFADQPVQGSWDPARISQVLSNLLSNAAKFGAARPIDVVVRGEADHATISVTDHGRGIATEEQQRIFERFARAASAEHFGGLGLGLFISRGIVDAHGGRIWVESEPGVATTFTVELPYASPGAAEGSRPEMAAGAVS